ncbi:MAG: hypothetical protein Ta2A_11870 [Treponemataceae bacterium]|nr:MAG: hypothetical protein Ta2A_11870 [Treponemataceae bacterium]
MKFFLNRFFIPELEIMKALQKYLDSIDIKGLYDRFTVSVTNDHPFAQLTSGIITNNGKINTSGVFPAIVVTTAGETKSTKLGLPIDINYVKCTNIADINGYVVTEKKRQEISAVIDEKGAIYGGEFIYRRKDDISIEIWAENIQLKNELYDLVKMFVLNIRDTHLEQFIERNAVAVFDDTIHGDRSNNYNFDFGITLAGSNITFELEYCNESVLLDTDLTEHNVMFIAKSHSQNAITEDEVMPPDLPPMLGG